MNALAFLVGLVAYLLVGSGLAFGALGVGFMSEPSRSIYGYVIVFAPLLLAGFLVGFIARRKASMLAALLATIAFAIFIALARGPIPYLVLDPVLPWGFLLQAGYQLVLYLAVSVFGAWLGNTVRPAHMHLERSQRKFASRDDV